MVSIHNLEMIRNVLKSVEISVTSETWAQVGRFFLIVCLPLLLFAAASVFYFDAPTSMYFKPRFGNPLHLWARTTTDIGEAGAYFAVAGGFWILFFILRKRAKNAESYTRWRTREGWALFALLSLVTSGLMVQGLKHAIGRMRPYADALLSSHEFRPFSANYEFHSLPSGHSQVLFTAASILTAIWPRAWYVWMISATVFATTRVITLNHWLSDIIAGAAVGMFGTVLTYRLMTLQKQKKQMAAMAAKAILGAAVMIGAMALPRLAHADSAGPFGIGLIIGDPTGLSANYRLSQQRSIDGALAWSFGRDPGFKIHSDYLWHRDAILRAEKFNVDLHYGVGARLWSLSNRHDDNMRFGARVPVGLSSNFNQRAIEVFVEIALGMNVIPSTSADLDAGIGARVYF